jgi:low temperature requirement protein LtrA
VSEREQSVSTLELFFDLVFVFTITQLTSVLAHGGLGEGLLRGVLMLGVVMWMYGGYAWLTNAVAINTTARRGVLLGAMAAYLVLALAIPHAFAGDGTVFGIAYLVIVVLHATLFQLSEFAGSRAGMLRIAPLNLVTGGLLLAGGIAGGDAQLVLWIAAFAGEWLTPALAGVQSFDIAPGHFVERHGLIVLVTIGESIVAVGIGASALPLDAEIVGVAVLGLLLSACLWWTYFGGAGDERAARAMAAAPPPERGRLAIVGFGYHHLALLLGIVGVAAGLEVAIAHPFDALDTDPAVYLAGGAALFLVGHALFRRAFGIDSGAARFLTAGALLATIPIGTQGSAVAQLSVEVALFAAGLALGATRADPV